MSSAMSIPGAVPAAVSSTNRFLWASVGALGATTLALGAALVQVNHRSADEVAPATSLPPAAAVATVLPAPELPVVQAAQAQPTAPAPEKVQKVVKPPVKYAQAAPKTVAKATTTVEPAVADSLPGRDQSWDPVATAPQPAAKVVCASCGTVETVTPIEREAAASGAGAAVGAVLGGLLGNQVGGGDGKTLATIAGIFGGGIAGNAVEKKMKKETVYEVTVRMEDGSLRRMEQSSPVAVGARVKVEGNTLSPAPSAAPTALPGVRTAA